MRKKFKSLKTLLMGSFFLFLVFSVFLVVHLYQMTGNEKDYINHSIELGRIDFEAIPDSVQIDAIKKFTYQIPGIKHVYFNYKDGIMVYGFDAHLINATGVYETLKSSLDIKVNLYRVSEEKIASSCPVTGRNSVAFKMGKYLVELFTFNK
jgi:hypothetical protein